MCFSGRPSPSPSPSTGGSSSGSQYALCALGVGLIALGVVMIAWSMVPSEATRNSSRPGGGGLEAKGRTSSVAFILAGGGVGMLMLSFCLGVRNKQHRQQWEGQTPEPQFQDHISAVEQGNSASVARELAASYDVPSYEEAVGSGQYPVRQSNLRHSASQLPSYDDLVDSREDWGPEDNSTDGHGPLPDSAPTSQVGRQHSRTGRKLLPLKVRRIKSEKLHLEHPPLQAGPLTIEPLTPPPQYEEKLPEL
ncbi:transmembrane protein 51a [Paramormyrops kingsleyae]|uniref:Transmembrane protein 51a n=1 Tax=Paramormyrops kingsleyae TaxID=1676925 RepID=A0A3B3SRW7_9TELE|nr:transmembrane protein 51 [Paramormyrops kingsleyae]